MTLVPPRWLQHQREGRDRFVARWVFVVGFVLRRTSRAPAKKLNDSQVFQARLGGFLKGRGVWPQADFQGTRKGVC